MLKSAYPSQPRWRWFLLLSLSFVVWYTFLCWYQLYRTLISSAFNQMQQQGLTRTRHLVDLLYLLIYLGAEVRSYYRLQLYQWPRRDWFNFIYDQELQNCHAVYSYAPNDPELELLRNKVRFAALMEEKHLVCVPTLLVVEMGSQLDPAFLRKNNKLFFKPCTGHGSQGCFSFQYSEISDEALLLPVDPSVSEDSVAHIRELHQVCEFFKDLGQQSDYLIQPMLSNHSFFGAICGVGEIVTLRVISGVVRGRPCLVYARLEVPVGNNQGCWALNVNCETGCIEDLNGPELVTEPAFQAVADALANRTLPGWQAIVSLICHAHTQLLGIRTIAWDLAVTQDGPCLIEGNSSWGEETLQTIARLPALKSQLRDVYCETLTNHHSPHKRD